MFPHRYARTTASVIVVLLAGLTLTGCMLLPRGGQSAAEAETLIETIPGVTDATVSLRSSLSGFTRSTYTRVYVTVADEYQVAAPDEQLAWGLRTAWSVNDQEPNVFISMDLTRTDGTPVEWDWASAVEKLGLDPEKVGAHQDRFPGSLSFVNRDDALPQLLGRWSAEVPGNPRPTVRTHPMTGPL